MELFIEYLEEGAHILLVAQRRIRKTSLMREAVRRIHDRFICLQVDLQQSHSAADAIVELSTTTRPHQSLWEKTKEIFSNALGSVASRLESLQIFEEEEKRPDDVQREILRILEHDGYLHREGDAYTFVFRLLKDWWRTHFGFGYSPVAGRKG